jgi:hypothetical protein
MRSVGQVYGRAFVEAGFGAMLLCGGVYMSVSSFGALPGARVTVP